MSPPSPATQQQGVKPAPPEEKARLLTTYVDRLLRVGGAAEEQRVNEVLALAVYLKVSEQKAPARRFCSPDGCAEGGMGGERDCGPKSEDDGRLIQFNTASFVIDQDKDYFEGCYRSELMRRLLANKYGEAAEKAALARLRLDHGVHFAQHAQRMLNETAASKELVQVGGVGV